MLLVFLIRVCAGFLCVRVYVCVCIYVCWCCFYVRVCVCARVWVVNNEISVHLNIGSACVSMCVRMWTYGMCVGVCACAD